MRVIGLALPAVAVATQAEEGNSGIQKVIEMLAKMKSQVGEETATAQKEEEAFQDQCIASIQELKSDIKYGAEKVEEFKADGENESAKAEAAGADAAKLAPAIASLEAEKKDAAKLRKEEHHEFSGKEAELEESVNMLGQAYSVLKRSLSFVQTPGGHSKMAGVIDALSKIIEAVDFEDKVKQKMRAFVQEDAELMLRQPQAKTSNYESKSGGILDAIEEMQDKTAEELQGLRNAEMKAKHAYEMVAQDLTNQVATKSDMLAEAQTAKAAAEAAAGKAAADLASAEEGLAADKDSLSDTQSDCKTSAEEWAARKKSADDEVAALTQAVDILAGKFSFLQTSTKNSDKRSEAALILRKLGNKFSQFGFLQAAQAAMDDPFVKVRGMVTDMISKLEEQAAKEADKHAKCKSAIEKGTKNLQIKKQQLKKYEARMDQSQAKYAQLGTDIETLNTEIRELNDSVAAWTKIRNEERTSNQATIKDAEESVDALNQAIKVLSDFYGAPALLQTGQPKSEAAKVILEVLQTAQEDFEKLRQETEAAESAAEEGFEKQTQKATVSLAKKNAMVQGKTQERATLKASIAQIDDDLEGASKAFEAANTFLKEKKEECTDKSMSYEERKRRREEEIAGLKQALEILAPEEESFIQTKSFLSRHK